MSTARQSIIPNLVHTARRFAMQAQQNGLDGQDFLDLIRILGENIDSLQAQVNALNEEINRLKS